MSFWKKPALCGKMGPFGLPRRGTIILEDRSVSARYGSKDTCLQANMYPATGTMCKKCIRMTATLTVGSKSDISKTTSYSQSFKGILKTH